MGTTCTVVSAVVAPSLSDDFNRADDTAFGGEWFYLPNNYTAPTSAGSPNQNYNWKTTSNRAGLNPGANNLATIFGSLPALYPALKNLGVGAQSISVDIHSADYQGIILAFDSYLNVVVVTVTDGNVRVHQVRNGTTTQLFSAAHGATPFHLRATYTPPTGGLATTTVDYGTGTSGAIGTDHFAGAWGGICAANATAAAIDNFSVPGT